MYAYLCLYMCVYVYVYMHTHTHTNKYTCTFPHTCARTHTHTIHMPAGAACNVQCVGVIRGDELANMRLNPTLQAAQDHGMRLEVSR